MTKNVSIIGAGPAGLAAAHKISKEKNFEVSIHEASEHVGGMARSFELFGQIVDLGPHRFFSKQEQINAFFRELIGSDFTMVSRQTRIFYNEKYFNYPLRGMDVLKKFSIIEIANILFSYFFYQIKPIKNPSTFEEWVTNKFGKKLFEIFFKNYSEKLWGIPCSNLDSDWAAQRIKSLSLFEAIKNAFFGDKKQKHNTLIDQFAYPKGGSGELYQKASEAIKKNGGNIYFNSKVIRVETQNDKIKSISLSNGLSVETDHVISTMPITKLVQNMDNVPKNVQNAVNNLIFRNTILLYLEINHPNLFDDNWIYIHSPEVRHGRITNFRNWCPSLTKNKNTSILCMEFWAFEKDPIWTADENNITELGTYELKKIKLLPKNFSVLNSKVIRIPNCYPVYEKGYQKSLNVVSTFLNSISNLDAIGRYGAFKYNNQDHSILMGILAAQKLITNDPIDLWSINTDTEYQEEGKIKDVLIG